MATTVSVRSSDQRADEERRRELAAFLRSRRDRLAPESVGIPVIGRRRAPGLRREEVAQLAGVGVTWYTWLEQGRPINVSSQVLHAIARALRFDDAEASHLYTLAGMPELVELPERQVIAGSIRTILDTLHPLPAYVVSERFDILAWNKAHTRLMGDFGRLAPERRNVMLAFYLEPAWRDLVGGYETEVGMTCVARFRRNFAGHFGDPHWHELLDTLLEQSAEFRERWERHDVNDETPRVKILSHPYVGSIKLSSMSLWLAEQPGTRLVIYTGYDQESQERLERLSDGEPWVPWLDPLPAQD